MKVNLSDEHSNGTSLYMIKRRNNQPTEPAILTIEGFALSAFRSNFDEYYRVPACRRHWLKSQLQSLSARESFELFPYCSPVACAIEQREHQRGCLGGIQIE